MLVSTDKQSLCSTIGISGDALVYDGIAPRGVEYIEGTYKHSCHPSAFTYRSICFYIPTKQSIVKMLSKFLVLSFAVAGWAAPVGQPGSRSTLAMLDTF
jgi:hypothetical protein